MPRLRDENKNINKILKQFTNKELMKIWGMSEVSVTKRRKEPERISIYELRRLNNYGIKKEELKEVI